MYQCEFVDTFTLVNFLYNAGAQYTSIFITGMVNNNITNFSRTLFEPIVGFEISCQFIKAAESEAERQIRIATLAALFSGYLTTAVSCAPATNAAMSGAIHGHISHMGEMLQTKGGSDLNIAEIQDFKIVCNLVKIPVFSNNHPYQKQFNYNSKIIVNNIFERHTGHRYIQRSTQKLITPGYLSPIASNQISNIKLFGWPFFVGILLIGCTTLDVLYIFQNLECKHWLSQKDEVLIDRSLLFSI